MNAVIELKEVNEIISLKSLACLLNLMSNLIIQ
jgi:hypothetical protein